MDPQRTLLAVALSIIVLLLFQSWNAQQHPKPATPTTTTAPTASAPASTIAPAAQAPAVPRLSHAAPVSGGTIDIETDLYRLKLDRLGGDIRQLVQKY